MSTARQKVFNRWVIILLALAVVISIGAVAIPWNGKDKNKSSANTSPTPQISLGLTGSGAQLATLLTGARQHTFHAKYKVTGDPALLGGTLVLEWWNKPAHSRVDTTRSDSSETVQTSSYINDSNGANCQRINSGNWTCQSVAVPGPGDPQGIITSLTSQLAGRPVTVSESRVGKIAALCFHVGGGTEPIDVCVDNNGVMLRNSSTKITYEITELDTNVTDSTFTLPAPIK